MTDVWKLADEQACVRRVGGLVEIVCEHGVGHPSKLLTPPSRYNGVHGCDGCCSKQRWTDYELELAMKGSAHE